MLSQASQNLALAASTPGRQIFPVNVGIGWVWDVQFVTVSWMRYSFYCGLVMTHNLSLGLGATFETLLDDEQVWVSSGGFGITMPFGLNGKEGYLIAGPQLIRAYNNSSTQETDVVVHIGYTLKRVSKEKWTWLRQNRSREQ